MSDADVARGLEAEGIDVRRAGRRSLSMVLGTCATWMRPPAFSQLHAEKAVSSPPMVLQRHHAAGMKARSPRCRAPPASFPGDAPWKGDVTLLDGAGCTLEDGAADAGCAWDRFLSPY